MENTADVEYYTTYPKTPGKKGGKPQLPVAHGHTLPPLRGHVPFGHFQLPWYLYYCTTIIVRKKCRKESTEKRYEEKVREKSKGEKVLGKNQAWSEHTSENFLQETRKKRAGNPVEHARTRGNPFGNTSLAVALLVICNDTFCTIVLLL